MLNKEQLYALLKEATGKERVVKIQPFKFILTKEHSFPFKYTHQNYDKYKDGTIESYMQSLIMTKIDKLQKTGKNVYQDEIGLTLINNDNLLEEIKNGTFDFFKHKYNLKLPIDYNKTLDNFKIESELEHTYFMYKFFYTFISIEKIGLSLTLEDGLLQIAYISSDDSTIHILKGIKSKDVRIESFINELPNK